MSRYSRQIAVPTIGEEGQARLNTSSVVVVGAGGLGIPACAYLTAAGVGNITVIDDDIVEETNLARQILYDPADTGRSKLDALLPKLAQQNPDVRVRGVGTRLKPENISQLFQGADLVLDASDNFATRYAISDGALTEGIPHVWGVVYRLEGAVGVFPPDRTLNYRALYPEQPPAFLAASCDTGGVAGPVCGLIGSLMASEALQYLAGEQPSLWARTATFDTANLAMNVADVARPQDSRIPVATHGDADITDTDMTAEEAAVRLSSAKERTVLIDVRTRAERAKAHIAGSLHVPLDVLWDWGRAAKPKDIDHIIFYCKTGSRSRQAVQIWRAVTDERVSATSVIGGIEALQNNGEFTCL